MFDWILPLAFIYIVLKEINNFINKKHPLAGRMLFILRSNLFLKGRRVDCF